jgi:Trypsin-like peptidase domain
MSARNRLLCSLVALLIFWASPALAQESNWKEEVAKTGAAATAFVEAKPSGFSTYGSAVCIHPSGLFLTNYHLLKPGFVMPLPRAFPQVVQPGAPEIPKDIKLVLNAGEKNEREYTARIVRSNEDLDLLLLRIDDLKEKLPALSLGSAEKLKIQMDVVAFGFPMGVRIVPPGKDKGFPAVSVNSGHISSLRKNAGVLEEIQMDAAVNPGNSGGPLLDKSGNIVGIVYAKMFAAQGIGYAIPVNVIEKFVAKPDFEFVAPTIQASKIHKPAIFEARVTPILPSATPITVDVILKADGGPERTTRMESTTGKHRVSIVPVPAATGTFVMAVQAQFAAGALNGTVADRSFKVGDRDVKFSQIESIQLKPKPRVLLQDGKVIEGVVSGLEGVPARLGDYSLTADLGKADDIKVTSAGAVDTLACTLVVRQGDKEIMRHAELLKVEGGIAAKPSASVTAEKLAASVAAVKQTVTSLYENLTKGKADEALKLFVNSEMPVVGVSPGLGLQKIWVKKPNEGFAGPANPHTVDSMEIEMLDETFAVARVHGHTQHVKFLAAITLTSEGGGWRIASYVFEASVGDHPKRKSPPPKPVVTGFYDTLNRLLAEHVQALCFSRETPVVGIPHGSGLKSIWVNKAANIFAGQHPPYVINSIYINTLDDSFAIARVQGDAGKEQYRAVITMTAEGGEWRIASYVYETRPMEKK